MGRWVCWLAALCTLGVHGHVWAPIKRNVFKSVGLAHLHVWAGYDCLCLRCGAWWRDAD